MKNKNQILPENKKRIWGLVASLFFSAFCFATAPTLQQNYLHQHIRPLPGHHYGRFRQIDFDGQSDCSPLRAIVVLGNGNAGLRVFPNPLSNGAIPFQLENTETKQFLLQILNASGQIEANCFFENMPSEKALPLPGTEQLRQGQYFLFLCFSNGETMTHMVQKI